MKQMKNRVKGTLNKRASTASRKLSNLANYLSAWQKYPVDLDIESINV